MRLGCNYTAIYQDLVDQFGFTGADNSVKRFAGRRVEREPEQFDRLEFAPSEESQVDYGEGALTRVPGGDRYRTRSASTNSLRVVMLICLVTLRCSRRTIRLVANYVRQQVSTGCSSDESMRRPRCLSVNRTSCLTLSTQSQEQRRERDPAYPEHRAQGPALRVDRATSDFLEHWEKRWAAQRIHGSVCRQIQAMFEEERAHLLPLPLTGFAYFTECERTVDDATCVRIDHSSYPTRPAPIGDRVLVRLFEHHLDIRDRATLALLRTHPRAQRRGSVLLPPEERPYSQRGRPQIVGGARKAAHS